MCQLFVANLGNTSANSIALTNLMMKGSLGNTDGTGLATLVGSKIRSYKTKLPANGISNLGHLVKTVTKDAPIFGHVRAASRGVEVSDENAHPFVGKRFSLMHNGRLYKKDEVVTYSSSTSGDDSIGSDSKQFHTRLEELAELNPEMPFIDLINLTMSEFKGKFAMLIIDSLTKDFYVCRGSSADLHIAYLDEQATVESNPVKIGFMIATKKITLADALEFTDQIIPIVKSGIEVITASAIEELKKNTVYKISANELVEVGECKENSVTYQTSSVQSATAYAKSYHSGYNPPSQSMTAVDLNIKIWSMSEKINTFMEKNFLTIQDIDMLLYSTVGKGIADCEEHDLSRFADRFIPVLSAKKKIRNEIKKHIGFGKVHFAYYERISDLEFPWMLSSDEAIQKLIAEIKVQSAK